MSRSDSARSHYRLSRVIVNGPLHAMRHADLEDELADSTQISPGSQDIRDPTPLSRYRKIVGGLLRGLVLNRIQRAAL